MNKLNEIEATCNVQVLGVLHLRRNKQIEGLPFLLDQIELICICEEPEKSEHTHFYGNFISLILMLLTNTNRFN